MYFLRFLKLSTDARHTLTCSLAQSYSLPLTDSGNTSTLFKNSKTGFQYFRKGGSGKPAQAAPHLLSKKSS